MKSALCSFVFLTCLASTAREAQACTCALSTLDQQLESADYAFAGTVLEIATVKDTSTSRSFLSATIAVEKVWKGNVPAEFEVWTWMSSASCGYGFEIGSKFVLYAFEPYNTINHVYTHICTRNKRYEQAAKDLSKLGPGFPPAGGIPPGFALGVPHPHPVSSRATLTFSVNRTQRVRVDVFDVLGRRVATLHDGPVQRDIQQSLALDAALLSAGLYVVRAKGDIFSRTRKVLVAK